MTYPYKDLPLTPTIAAERIIELLAAQSKPVERAEIARQVAERHALLGGAISRTPIVSVKKAISRLVDEGRLRRHALGWYSLVSSDGEASIIPPVTSPPQPAEPSSILQLEQSVGEGDETVYVYFNEAERKLAELEQRDRWPCKVGYTAGELSSRIFGQNIGTGMARPPVIGLIIKTDDGYGLEKALHHALDAAQARIDDAVGSEWFETSPRRIVGWFEAYQKAIGMLT